jgi:VanZ family protein
MALVLLVVIGPLVGAWLVGRERIAWTMAGLSLLPVAVLTFVPVDRVPYERCTVQWALPTPSRVELMANVVLFVAPVLFAAVALRNPALALLAGSGLSVMLEAVQALVPAIGRSCDTTDWLSNTIGALVGAALGWIALRLAGAKVDHLRRAEVS